MRSLLISIAVLLIGCDIRPQPIVLRNQNRQEVARHECYRYQAEPVRVIDGDTLIVMIDLGFHVRLEQTLRLAGINAPELRGETRQAGLVSRDVLSRLIDQHAPIHIETIQDKTDKYGRYLAILRGADGVNLNDLMVEQNAAIAMP